MLLAIDIGNSSTKFGFFDGEILISRFSVRSASGQTADELYDAIKPRIVHPVTGVIVSSVVPELETSIREFSLKHFGTTAVFVTNDFDFGFSSFDYHPISSAGTDRLIAASAAVRKYGKPCIVCDFGTATTIDCVDSGGVYLGGVITPGMDMLADALHTKTSKLPKITVEKPENLIGSSTKSAIQSGIYYGYIGLVEGILKRIIAELDETPKIIATGGFATMIAESCSLIEIVDENLILEGLRMIHEAFATPS